ncbi:class III signal peptide-containing protein [Methanotorris formicicus]|uniref:Class III signal peptide-containing protein n=1 Tax=Methanotorris formicicus Mc-S-70 TaxID=647171 RepID=H1KW78_9EURY|nr:class III signal peptide-containing protein [Methanotorris formicicus]EHP89661.1 protein of unknown function DUF361 [Methanotorris formicicus Mc-S-70]
MKLVEKLMSKRGQVSMEIGILVAAAVAVAAIVAYYYTTRVKESMQNAGTQANATVNKLGEVAENATSKIPTI